MSSQVLPEIVAMLDLSLFLVTSAAALKTARCRAKEVRLRQRLIMEVSMYPFRLKFA